MSHQNRMSCAPRPHLGAFWGSASGHIPALPRTALSHAPQPHQAQYEPASMGCGMGTALQAPQHCWLMGWAARGFILLHSGMEKDDLCFSSPL